MANSTSSLSAFMAQNAQKAEGARFAVSKRFVDEAGKPMLWEVCTIDAGENVKIRKGCMRQELVVGGRKGQTAQVFDAGLYQARVCARCTVFPNLKSAELQDSYGVHSDEELVVKMLLPGEFEDYSEKVLECNGFESVAELVDEAKN